MSIAHTNDKDKSESLMELTAQVENFVRQSAAEGCALRDFGCQQRWQEPRVPTKVAGTENRCQQRWQEPKIEVMCDRVPTKVAGTENRSHVRQTAGMFGDWQLTTGN